MTGETFAVVTGGTKGLGRAVALALATRGYAVQALYHSDDAATEELRALAEPLRGRLACLRHDVTAGPLPLPFPFSFNRFVLVHCAVPPFAPGPLHLARLEDVTMHCDVAVRGLLACALPLLRELPQTGRGIIVGVSSLAASGADTPARGFAVYAAAKAAMSMVVRGLGREYGRRGLRTFCVVPGFMATSLTEAWPSVIREGLAKVGASTPEVVARRICELIDDESIPACGEDHAC